MAANRNLRSVVKQLENTVLVRVGRRYAEANVGIHAAAIAYTTIFALFPILLAMLILVSLFIRNDVAFQQVTAALAQILPGTVATETVNVLRGTSQQSGLLGVITFLGLLWTGSALFGVYADAFNRLYGVANRPILQQRIMAVAMILVFAVLLLISIVATTAAQLVIQFADLLPIAGLPGFKLLTVVISYAVSFGSALLLFIAIYYVVPNVKLTVREVLPGALLTAALFVILIQAFPLYGQLIGHFQRYGSLFGFIFLILTWFYFIGLVLLVGGALNAVLSPHPHRRQK